MICAAFNKHVVSNRTMPCLVFHRGSCLAWPGMTGGPRLYPPFVPTLGVYEYRRGHE